MLLTIHGLPVATKYHDLKVLVKQKCNVMDFVLDNLTLDEDGTKKVEIVISNARDSHYLIEGLDGYRMSGSHILRVISEKQASNAPLSNFEHRGYPPRKDYPQGNLGYGNRPIDNTGGRPNNLGGRPHYEVGGSDHMGGRQGRVSGRPEHIGNRPDQEVGRNDYMGGRNDHISGRNDYVSEKSDHIGGRLDHMGRKSENISARPSHIGGRSDPIAGRADHMRGQPELIGGRADIMGGRNHHIGQRPDHGGGRPEHLGGRYDNIDGRSDYISGRADIMVRPELGRIPEDIGNRPDPWETNSNPWTTETVSNPASQSVALTYGQQAPPHTSEMSRPYDQRNQYPSSRMPTQDQGYGIPPKILSDSPVQRSDGRSVTLRSVEIIDEPLNRPISSSSRYPGPSYDLSQKPILIMKENFQGPQYNLDHVGSTPDHYGHRGEAHQPPASGHGQQSWNQPILLEKQLPYTEPGQFEKSYDDRKYPEPDKRQILLTKDLDKARDLDPYIKPGPRFSPRRDIPAGLNRRDSPPGRRISPSGRRFSPSSGRRTPDRSHRSPGRRDSPRIHSPSHKRSPQARRDSPSRLRFSPSRRHLDKAVLDKYGPPESRSGSKDARPAYDSNTQASNQAMYSGGYRPGVRENIQYPISGSRYSDQRNLPWQDREKFSSVTKKEDDRRMPKFEPRMDAIEAKGSGSPRRSRSPLRRSPPRDRIKKHSPSPRSPRRSWALEKRRSPDIRDAPPPPMWPALGGRDDAGYKPRYDRGNEEKKHVPVWDMTKSERRDRRSDDEERRFENPGRVRFEKHSESTHFKPEDRYREPKFEPRDPKFEPREPKFEPRNPKFEPREPKFEAREPKFEPRQLNFEPRDSKYESRGPKFEPREEFKHPDFHRDDVKKFDRDVREVRGDRELEHRREELPYHASRRDEFQRRNEERKPSGTALRATDRDLEEIYKRAVEFRERSDELLRNANRKHESHPVDRHDKELDMKVQDDDDRRHDRYSTMDTNWLEAKSKKDKAIREITNNLIAEFGQNLSVSILPRIREELHLSVAKSLTDMFGGADVTFIEMVIKFNARHEGKKEKFLNDVLKSFPSHYRKRSSEEAVRNPEFSSKIARHTPESELTHGMMAGGIIGQHEFKRPATPLRKKVIATKKSVPVTHPQKHAASKSMRPMVAFSGRSDLVKRRRVPVKRAQTEEKVPKVVEKRPKIEEKPSNDVKKTLTPEKPVEQKADTGRGYVKPEPSVKPRPEGYYELNGTMSRVLENELQNIMIKVWQELPDEPPSEAERLVVDKLRTKVSDDFRNVLGLNVTKRLLNIHNPLFVKLMFSRKPSNIHLKALMKEHNFLALKKLGNQENFYVAQMKSLADFDKLCSAGTVPCGSRYVKVSPCCKFTMCPPEIKTMYDEKNVKTKTTEEAQTDKSPEKDITKKSPEKVQTELNTPKTTQIKNASETHKNSNPDKKNPQNIVSPNKSTEAVKETLKITKPIPDKNKEVGPPKVEPTDTTSLSQKVQSQSTPNIKTNVSKEAEKTVLKTDSTSKLGEKPNATTKPLEKAKENVNIVENTNVVAKSIEKAPQKALVTAKAPQIQVATVTAKLIEKAPQNASVAAKPIENAPQKATVTSKPTEKASQIGKAIVSGKSVANPVQKINITPKSTQKAKVSTQSIEKPKVAAKSAQPKVNAKTFNPKRKTEAGHNPNDFEEMNDEDILALISDAIVLDECTGSDEEH